jgi:spore coat polysaccharide biosynthesis protein SpsF
MYLNNQKKIIATIEARMTSSRLPGKVLLPLAGKPALERMIERIKRSKFIDEIVVATTTNSTDDCIADLCKKNKIGCFRGSEEDVLGRVLGAAKTYNADIIVELTGDCPVIDHRLIDQCIELFFNHQVDYASNIIESTFANGFDVQVFSTSVLAEVDKLTNDPIDRTHVSYYIYKHPERYKLYNWQAKGDYYWPEMRVTLDEQDDYKLLAEIYDRLYPQNKDFSALDIIKLLHQDKNLFNLNVHVRQKEIQEG